MNFTAKLIITTPLLFLLLCSIDFFHSIKDSSYDSWRVLQCIIIALSISGYAIVQRHNKFYVSKRVIATALILFVLSVISILLAANPMLAILDATLWLSITLYIYVLYSSQNTVPPHFTQAIIAIVSLLPIYFIISLLIGWYLYFAIDMPPVWWHAWFENIRYYDDTLLPLVFLLWSRPGFLNRYKAIVLILSSFYLLTLWLDGARANALSILVGLLVAGFIYKQQFKVLLLPIASIVISFILLALSHFLLAITQVAQADEAMTNLARASSSGRITLWKEVLMAWLSSPLFGIGGGNTITANSMNLGHPHNIVIQLWVEWGIVGLAIIALLTLLLGYIYNNRHCLSPILMAGVIALAINMLLSGAHIYPSSQMTMVVILAYGLHQIAVTQSQPDSVIKNKNNNLTATSLKVGIPFAYLFIVPLILCVTIIVPNLFRYNIDIGPTRFSGPRFWLNANEVILPDKE